MHKNAQVQKNLNQSDEWIQALSFNKGGGGGGGGDSFSKPSFYYFYF